MIRTSIVGAGGYAGAELVSLLLAHSEVEVVGLYGSAERAPGSNSGAATRFDESFPRFWGLCEMPIEPTSIDAIMSGSPDAVFLATPHEVSHELAPDLLSAGAIVIDLSAAFRLRHASDYIAHYGFEHKHPLLLQLAVYGLPERNAEHICGSNLIAMPGCYPTSVVLALAPLVDAGLIETSRPVIADCTSGVSGAGRAPALKSHFCEVSYQPYGVLSHRHTPEICRYSAADVIFTPHLAPFDRGIVSTIHAALASDVSESAVRSMLDGEYSDEPFVRILPSGAWPSVGGVRNTNFCDIGFAVDETRRHLVLASAIDNLLKGAAGQALQCFNIRFGLPPTAGLPMARRELAHA